MPGMIAIRFEMLSYYRKPPMIEAIGLTVWEVRRSKVMFTRRLLGSPFDTDKTNQ
jgi:hypothetical protein